MTITKLAGIDVADMRLFPKPILLEAEESQFSDMRIRIDQLKQKLLTEQQALKELQG